MIDIPYLYIVIFFMIIWAIYRTLTLIKSEEKNILREIIINIFFVYFLVLINFTICKMGAFQIRFDGRISINYIPLIETIKMFTHNDMGVKNGIYNVIGNILLFMPLGFFIPLLFEKRNKFLSIVKYAFLLSFSIEIIQLLNIFTLTDIDDIIFNVFGAILGFYVYKVFLNFIYKKIQNKSNYNY